jgi:hypothetical protein
VHGVTMHQNELKAEMTNFSIHVWFHAPASTFLLPNDIWLHYQLLTTTRNQHIIPAKIQGRNCYGEKLIANKHV